MEPGDSWPGPLLLLPPPDSWAVLVEGLKTRQGRALWPFIVESLKLYRKEGGCRGAGGGGPTSLSPQRQWFPPSSALWREENRSARRSASLGQGRAAEAPAPLLGTVTLGASFRFLRASVSFWDSA